jgi:hypothetical protein
MQASAPQPEVSGGGISGIARLWARPALPLLGVLVLIVLCTFRQYGLTWDEESGWNYSLELRDFYSSMGTVEHALNDKYMRFYGGFFEICAGIGEKNLPFGMYENRHLVIALFGLVGIVFAYKLGSLLGGRRGGLAAAAFLTLTPLYYGHMFNNPKDLPFASVYLVAVYYIVALRRRFPDISWGLATRAAIAIGLTLAIRIGGAVLFGLLAAAVVLAVVARSVGARRDRAPSPPARRGSALLKLALIPVLSWLLMCALWPYALVSPFKHPIEAWKTFSEYSWSGTMLFAGRMVSSHHLPRTYVPTWLAVRMPDFLLVATAIVVIAAVLGRPKRLWRLADPDWLILAAAGAGPIIFVIVQRTVIYDGIRHLLFAIPPLVVLVAVAITGLVEEVSRRGVKWAISLAVALPMVLTATDMVSLHPYQSVYFNRLIAGGLRGAAGRFETDYWGSSYKEAVEWVIANVEPRSGTRLRIGNPNASFLTSYYIKKSTSASARFVNVEPSQATAGDVDLFITTTREGNDKRFPGKPVLHRVERQGVPLAFVVEVKPDSWLPRVRP